MKVFFAFVLVLFIQLKTFAQTDSLSIFHQSPNNASLSKDGVYKNAVNFNILQILRGSALISYERLLGTSGFALTAGAGICKFDALGQIYFRQLSYYYNLDNYVTKSGTKIKPLYEIGLKYYYEQLMGGSYIAGAFTSIKNTVNLQPFGYQYYVNTPSNINQLDYRSNELKLLIGFTNANNQRFYHDFSIGFGYRFIQYEYYYIKGTNNASGNSAYSYELDKGNKTNQTPWFFISWKMGLRL